MESLKLRENFYWTGIVDDNLRVFDIIMYTEFGTTYNSYVMKAGDKTVLFETAKAKFFDEYLEKLKELTLNTTDPKTAIPNVTKNTMAFSGLMCLSSSPALFAAVPANSKPIRATTGPIAAGGRTMSIQSEPNL